MTTFHIPDMSCGHCVATITSAVKRLDPQARVEVDLAKHRVAVDSSEAPERLAEAIREEGYRPVLAA